MVKKSEVDTEEGVEPRPVEHRDIKAFKLVSAFAIHKK